MNTNYFLTEGNRENEGYRFLEAAESFVFFVAFCLRSLGKAAVLCLCAFVSISGLDFVNLPDKQDFEV